MNQPKFPFKQAKSGQVIIREFAADTDPAELVWHRDREDRLVTVIESSGWSLQMDGELPQLMEVGQTYYIPRNVYHRVIKGTGRLMIEIDEMKKDMAHKYATKIMEGIRKRVTEAHPEEYKAPEGSKRDKQLDQTQKDLDRAEELRKQGKTKEAKELEQRAYNRRDRMEKKARKDEGRVVSETALRRVIRDVLLEKKQKMSKKTEKALKKKAEEKGFTLGSLKQEYRKGLGAYYSSGSRPGMTAHQWAMARVNKAMSNPSLSWAVVKKSKSKKKK